MTTARQNQISWAQFSHRERLQHQLQADFIRECRANAKDNDEEKFDISVSTPRRGAQTKRRPPRVRFVFERQPQQLEQTPENNNEKTHEEIKKPKTRAEKRAVETEACEQIEAAPKHKERRSDYWVQQDDLRMKRARGFKLPVDNSVD
jgi:hypothetical protein